MRTAGALFVQLLLCVAQGLALGAQLVAGAGQLGLQPLGACRLPEQSNLNVGKLAMFMPTLG